MTEVVEFPGITTLNMDPDRVLEAAVGKLTEAVVIGYDKDGAEYVASSVADGPDTLWMIERAKFRLMAIVDEVAE